MPISGGRLTDRSIAITGGASGIGRATVLRALSEGATVAAIDRDEAGLHDLADDAAEDRLSVHVADVADDVSIERALEDAAEKTGGLDVVYANAGVGMDPTPVTDISVDEWDRILAVNLSGAFFTLRAGVEHLRRRGGGLLLATGSSTALRPGTGMYPYVAAKAGLHTLVRSLALELAAEGIRAVVLAPGLTATAMTVDRPGYIENGLRAVPLGELVEVDHVAAMAVHLMTDEARSVTGSTFVIDAGRTSV